MLSDPRAVTISITVCMNYMQRSYAIPMPECIFLTFCNSRPWGVALDQVDNVLVLRAIHFCLCVAPSVGATISNVQHLSCRNRISARDGCECLAAVWVVHFRHGCATLRECACKFQSQTTHERLRFHACGVLRWSVAGARAPALFYCNFLAKQE